MHHAPATVLAPRVCTLVPFITIINKLLYVLILLIDGLGHTTLSVTYLSQASCVIASGLWFKAALDLETYPLSNLIHPRCAEQAKHMMYMRLKTGGFHQRRIRVCVNAVTYNTYVSMS